MSAYAPSFLGYYRYDGSKSIYDPYTKSMFHRHHLDEPLLLIFTIRIEPYEGVLHHKTFCGTVTVLSSVV